MCPVCPPCPYGLFHGLLQVTDISPGSGSQGTEIELGLTESSQRPALEQIQPANPNNPETTGRGKMTSCLGLQAVEHTNRARLFLKVSHQDCLGIHREQDARTLQWGHMGTVMACHTDISILENITVYSRPLKK